MIACTEVMAQIDPEHPAAPDCYPRICCDSCHDDYDLGYYMCEIEFSGEWVEVCCAVSVAWGDRD